MVTIVTATVVHRFAPTVPTFVRVREVASFLATAVFVPGLVACGFVVAIYAILPTEELVRHGWTDGAWNVASWIWLSNTAALLIFLPVILVWSKEWQTLLRTVSVQRFRAPVLIMAGLIVVSLIVFTRNFTPLYLLRRVMIGMAWSGPGRKWLNSVPTSATCRTSCILRICNSG